MSVVKMIVFYIVVASALLLQGFVNAAPRTAGSKAAAKTGSTLPVIDSKLASSAKGSSTHNFSPFEARVMLVTASCMYGSNYITTKLLQDRIEPAMVTTLRFIVASVFFGPSIGNPTFQSQPSNLTLSLKLHT